MPCEKPIPFYVPPTIRGVNYINSMGDGYTMDITWRKAYSDPVSYSIAYNIYYSTIQDNEIIEGPKYVSTNICGFRALIVDFTPGDLYYFVVRATQYDPSWYNINLLPTDDSQTDGYIHLYPETLLSADIADDDLIIPITDVDIFPAYGVIQVGYELIRYTSKDIPNGTLIASERGFYNSNARLHNADGYDGYTQLSPIVTFWKGIEEQNMFIIQEQSVFNSSLRDVNEIYTVSDGYRDVSREGILTTDLNDNDDDRVDFPMYDYCGWRRTDPKLFFQGKCTDSYIGGENFGADGYGGVSSQIRNIPIFEQSDRRQEMLLEQLGTGESVVLLRRLYSGITCSCVDINQELPDPRCGSCYGTYFQGGYKQYYNPRRSDGRLLVRFSPSTEDLKVEEAGLESHVVFPCWTLTVPALNDRDVIIRFAPDGVTEEFRYEILDVTRNKLLYGQTGRQEFKAQRVRKTSPIYQWRAIRSTANIPQVLITTVGLLRGPNNVPIPHTHQVVINEGIVSLAQINHTTSQDEGHEHLISSGTVLPAFGHTHNIILP